MGHFPFVLNLRGLQREAYVLYLPLMRWLWLERLSPTLKEALAKLAVQTEVYLSGGTIRDLLLKRPFRDLDLVLPNKALAWAEFLAREIKGKAIVLHQEEGVVRVASPEGLIIDFSEFRGGAKDIFQDLKLRDFTINALAVPLKVALLKPVFSWEIIDPTSGRQDLARRLIRVIAKENFEADPLRLLRAYRLMAELDFILEERTRSYVAELKASLLKVAVERIATELRLLFETPQTGKAVSLMDEDGLLGTIFPELETCRGVEQPSFHHLDVLGHSLLALEMADQVLKDPLVFFGQPEGSDPFDSVVRDAEKASIVRMAALFHDIGKPATFKIRDRITFYEHDRVGAELFEAIGKRLRFPKKFTQMVSLLIRQHMRPFHLLKEFLAGRLTPRAMRRLIKACPDYVSLFLVAMADSLASAGPDKEADVEKHLASLFWKIHRFYQETMAPMSQERLVTGRDLIDLFGLEPGPWFRELLEAVEEARVEGKIRDRQEALDFLTKLLRKKFSF